MKKISNGLGLKGSKSPQNGPKIRFFGFSQKCYRLRYSFLLQQESVNDLLTFCKNNVFGKNFVLELWSKNVKANQNAGFFKLQNLINELRREVEFMDMTRGP